MVAVHQNLQAETVEDFALGTELPAVPGRILAEVQTGSAAGWLKIGSWRLVGNSDLPGILPEEDLEVPQTDQQHRLAVVD